MQTKFLKRFHNTRGRTKAVNFLEEKKAPCNFNKTRAQKHFEKVKIMQEYFKIFHNISLKNWCLWHKISVILNGALPKIANEGLYSRDRRGLKIYFTKQIWHRNPARVSMWVNLSR